MSLFRALGIIPGIVGFGVQSLSKVTGSLGTVNRLFGSSSGSTSSENESGNNLTEMDRDPSATQKFMIVGLGNSPYPDTRHSVGMRALDDFADRHGLTWEKVHGIQGGLLCKTEIDCFIEKEVDSIEPTQIYLFKPKSLMNICGGNVAKIAKSLGVRRDSIYLVHDELDLALGKVSIKNGGSANGHKGVQSCIMFLKAYGKQYPREPTDEIVLPRLRIGIGRPSSKSQVVTYVLASIPDHEVQATDSAIHKGMDLLMHHITDRVRKQAEQNRDRTDIT